MAAKVPGIVIVVVIIIIQGELLLTISLPNCLMFTNDFFLLLIISSSSYGTSNIIKSNFNKGVLIELGNGELKPVEEMRTEDFILSSNVTPDLEMIDSTILRIMPHGNVIVLTLSNSASKLNVSTK